MRAAISRSTGCRSRHPGILTNLSLNATSRREPGPGEIEVQVKAGGINFRDVMKALGMYPGNPVDVRWFGDDFSGTVVRVAPDVTDVRVGDNVAGMGPYVFRGYVTVNRHMVFKKPDHVSFTEAATMPTVFLTTHYALKPPRPPAEGRARPDPRRHRRRRHGGDPDRERNSAPRSSRRREPRRSAGCSKRWAGCAPFRSVGG